MSADDAAVKSPRRKGSTRPRPDRETPPRTPTLRERAYARETGSCPHGELSRSACDRCVVHDAEERSAPVVVEVPTIVLEEDTYVPIPGQPDGVCTFYAAGTTVPVDLLGDRGVVGS